MLAKVVGGGFWPRAARLPTRALAAAPGALPHASRLPVPSLLPAAAGALLRQPARGLLCLNTRLGRGRAHRWAMLRNLVKSLIEHERIKTTHARARELRRVADRVINFGKQGTAHARVQAGKYVSTRPELVKLFTILAERYKDRLGGYTRVLKTYPRIGDSSPMSFVELVDRPVHTLRTPPTLAEQPQSAYPGRGGRKWRAHKRDMRSEWHKQGTPRNTVDARRYGYEPGADPS